MASASSCTSSVFLLILVVFVCLVPQLANAREPLQWEQQQQHLHSARKFPTVVTGFVFCDSCLEKNYTFNTLVIPNVSASISCEGFEASNITNKFGFFVFEIPEAIAAKVSTCTVKVSHDSPLVQGELSKCNQAVEFPAAAAPEKWKPSSTPYAFQSDSSFYFAGPFMFQPPEMLSFCHKFSHIYPHEP